MEKLTFNIEINASAQKVWQVLWSDLTYRKWTCAFQEGSYAVSDWNKDSKIQFLNPDGEGMYSVIEECLKYEYMAFKHLGVIKNFEEQPESDETQIWSGIMETYALKEVNGITTLIAKMDTVEQYVDYFDQWFPKALDIVKELSEHPVMITIEALVKAPVEKAWTIWTSTEHITKWNNASEDWHTPYAENDLRAGGKFLSRMEAKDGSFGFDFWGIYDEVKPGEFLSYTMGDGRKANIKFIADGTSTKMNISFEAETENSFDIQQYGWQSILNNFKKYTETNKDVLRKEHA
jgi:uncharacterized protein YndB with AHSA1/START domain